MEKNHFTIAVINPDVHARTIITRILNQSGFAAQAFSSYSHLKGHHLPDLLIIDISAMDSSGADVCRKFRSASGTAYIPVIVLASCNEHRASCKEAGADEYVVKPCPVTVLLSTISRMLQPYRHPQIPGDHLRLRRYNA